MYESVDELTITTVVDNYIDAMVGGTDRVERFDVAKHLSRRASPDGNDCLVKAEHGVSMLIEWTRGSNRGLILYDAGWTPEVLLNNLKTLDIDPAQLDAVVISHAHIDHYGGLFDLLRHAPGTPVYARPEGFYPKFIRNRKGETLAPLNSGFTRRALNERGRLIECDEEGTEVTTPVIRTTGAIPLANDFEPPVVGTESGTGLFRKVDGEWLDDDPPVDEQGLVVNLGDRGLVVLTGCGHTGIVNTVQRASERFGGAPIHAVVGGFHTGNQPDERVSSTLEALKKLNPRCLSPMHCTGHRVINRIEQAFPDAFVLNMVGTRITV